MKTLYLDLVSGISGDMFLGAMLDLGVNRHELESALRGLGVTGYHLHVGRESRSGIVGTRFDVHLETDHSHDHPETDSAPAPAHEGHGGGHHSHEHAHGAEGHHHAEHRDFATIRQWIAGSALADWVKEKAIGVFARIAAAEGKIHGQPPEAVHFHEVGAVDSIVDIVGACAALDLLGRPRVLASPVVDGSGWVRCAHGRFPVPTPATLEILGARGVAVSQCDEPNELVTPTGAALLAEFVEDFGPLRGLRPERIGYGIGGRENRTRPNVLRAILGVAEGAGDSAHDWETDTVIVLETNLDDSTPELLAPVLEQVMAAGALDAACAPVLMKKGRPGVLLSVLARVADADSLTALLLRHTSAFGVRRSACERRKLRRELWSVSTPFGTVAVKVGWLDGEIVQAMPEFENCRRLADAEGVAVRTVYAAAQAGAWRLLQDRRPQKP
ncbi:MAG: nickel pincer cofactor biosynthesis protein LarC [Verrucomicrobia bacterium]|nr:nickel pincer cofactor biosynthesis protein LarC [Verrucomicrobiota bacterium]